MIVMIKALSEENAKIKVFDLYEIAVDQKQPNFLEHTVTPNFMKQELKIDNDKVNDISIERTHRNTDKEIQKLEVTCANSPIIRTASMLENKVNV